MTTLIGSEVPRLATPPAGELTPETSRGFEVIEFAEDVLGLELMPWQKWVLIHGLELADDGSFRFRTLLVGTARQSGKSTLLQVLALWRMYVDGAPLVLGTAQNLALAEETWTGALLMAESVPELAREVAHVSRTNGDKFMRLTSGERYKVAAATRSGGRGLSSDLVLLDELREHRDWEAWSAITKTTLARPAPQVLGFSNAGDRSSVVLASLREKALASAADRSTTLGIFEWSAPDGCALDDRAAWGEANPALGHRMTEQAIASALETDPEDVFRTEVLNQWVTAVGSAIDATIWTSLADPDAVRGDRPVFVLDVAVDHSTASVGVAWRRPDGAAHVMLADQRAGVDWAVDRCAELLRAWNGRLLIEQTGTAAFLLPALQSAGVTVETVSRRFYVEACAALDAAVSARTLRHGNQPELNDAVAVARWSTSGDAGQRVLSRKDPRVSALVAVTIAAHGLTTTPRITGGWLVGLP
ncbi:terminase large subunit [Trujillonella endophytica]|nr:terminase large subunit [Trujillella endophytica]